EEGEALGLLCQRLVDDPERGRHSASNGPQDASSRPGHAFKYLAAIHSVIAIGHCPVSRFCIHGDETERRCDLFPQGLRSQKCQPRFHCASFWTGSRKYLFPRALNLYSSKRYSKRGFSRQSRGISKNRFQSPWHTATAAAA